MISIIIPAYKATNFLEECIESVVRQNIDKKIFLGIDGCIETLHFALSNTLIKQNCNIYYFEKNVGTYLVLNSMISYADDKIVFFGADDIMFDGLIKEADEALSNFDIVRWKYYNFTGSLENKIDTKEHSPGNFATRKNLLLKLNGFFPWKMSADWEFQLRAKQNNATTFLSNFYFDRRIHENNMTVKEDTGMKSAARKIHIDYIAKSTEENNFVNPDQLYVSTNRLISSLNK